MSTNESGFKMSGINGRQRAFVLEYLKDPKRNATRAYIAAGYAARGNAAEVSASQLLRHPQVAAVIARHEIELTDQAMLDARLDLAVLLRQIQRGATFDVRKMLDADGNPLPLHELDDDSAAAIAGLDLVTEHDKEGRPSTVVRRYRIADRKAWVDLGLKVLGGYKKDNEQAGKASVNALSTLLASMKRSALPVVEHVDHDENL